MAIVRARWTLYTVFALHYHSLATSKDAITTNLSSHHVRSICLARRLKSHWLCQCRSVLWIYGSDVYDTVYASSYVLIQVMQKQAAPETHASLRRHACSSTMLNGCSYLPVEFPQPEPCAPNLKAVHVIAPSKPPAKHPAHQPCKSPV